MAKKKSAKKTSKATAKAGIAMYVYCDKNVNKCWYWKLVAHNGERLAVSEAYGTREDCAKTANQMAEQLGVDIVWNG